MAAAPRRPYPPRDAVGRRIRPGDRVRVLAVPDLSGMAPSSVREVRAICEHLVGTYRRIRAFDPHGHAEIAFLVRRGPHAGRHAVWLEPWLLRRAAPRSS